MNFPPFSTLADVQMRVGVELCDGNVCAIKLFLHSASSTKMSILVPALSVAGLDMLRLEYDQSRHSTKFAEHALEYYHPEPAILWVRFCSECNDGAMCIANCKCKHSVPPLKGAATLAMPNEKTTNTVANCDMTIVLDNVPPFDDVMDAAGVIKPESDDSIWVNFGGILASLRRVRVSTSHRMVSTPPGLEQTVKTPLAVAIHTSSSAKALVDTKDNFVFLDPKVTLNSSTQDFAAVNVSPFTATIFDLPVSKSGASDEIDVKFGHVSAKSFAVLSHVATAVVLLISPPGFKLMPSDCASKSVSLHVSLRSDSAVGAQMKVTFWALPSVTMAEFDGKGTSIFVLFDQVEIFQTSAS